MSRRRRPEKREILPDPKFHSELLAKFMNMLMHDGKKSVAEGIVYGALERISERQTHDEQKAIEVLEQVPQAPQLEASEQFLTLTSCNPRFSAAERIIAYAVFETWYPREDGAPSEIAPLVDAAGAPQIG